MPRDLAEPADILRTLGMHPKYKGYAYMLSVLSITRLHPAYVYSITTHLYKSVAREFGTSLTSVERNIRFAIKRTWENGNKCELVRMFHVYDANYIPTNAEFIAVLTECMYNGRFQAPVQLTMSLN